MPAELPRMPRGAFAALRRNACVKAMENEHPIIGLCEAFGVSRSGVPPLR